VLDYMVNTAIHIGTREMH